MSELNCTERLALFDECRALPEPYVDFCRRVLTVVDAGAWLAHKIQSPANARNDLDSHVNKIHSDLDWIQVHTRSVGASIHLVIPDSALEWLGEVDQTVQSIRSCLNGRGPSGALVPEFLPALIELQRRAKRLIRFSDYRRFIDSVIDGHAENERRRRIQQHRQEIEEARIASETEIDVGANGAPDGATKPDQQEIVEAIRALPAQIVEAMGSGREQVGSYVLDAQPPLDNDKDVLSQEQGSSSKKEPHTVLTTTHRRSRPQLSDVTRKSEKWCVQHGFPGVNELAKQMGVSNGYMSETVIPNSEILKELKRERELVKQDRSRRRLERREQSPMSAPDIKVAADDFVQHLIQNSEDNPTQRAYLNGLDESGRVKLYIASQGDDD